MGTTATILVILFFGGSIFIHELGHFLAAKLFGLKVLRFSIGFGPRLWSWRGRDGCRYMVSLLPFGGYVAIPQLADMGRLEGGGDDDFKEAAGLPEAGGLAKCAVAASGALFNLILAFVFAVFVWIAGVPEFDAYSSTTVGYVPEKIESVGTGEIPSPAKAAGIEEGDKILSVDGNNVDDFLQIMEQIAMGSGRDADGAPLARLKIEREGKILDITVRPALVRTNPSTDDRIRMIGIQPAMRLAVDSVMPRSPAERAGLKSGDEIVSVNGKKVFSNQQVSDILSGLPKGAETKIGLIRDSQALTLKAVPQKIERTRSLLEISSPDGSANIALMATGRGADKISGRVVVCANKSQNPLGARIGISSVLYRIGNTPIDGLGDAENALKSAGSDGLSLSFIFDAREMMDAPYLPQYSVKKIPPQTVSMLGYTVRMEADTKHPTPAAQFSDSIRRTYAALASLINPKTDVGISSLAGPVDIGRIIYKLSATGLASVVSFMVLINVNLAILNLLPIPVLDGGHIMFAVIEKLRGGKKLPQKFFFAMQSAFSMLLIALMAYVVYIGFMRWNGDRHLEKSTALDSLYYITPVNFENHE